MGVFRAEACRKPPNNHQVGLNEKSWDLVQPLLLLSLASFFDAQVLVLCDLFNRQLVRVINYDGKSVSLFLVDERVDTQRAIVRLESTPKHMADVGTVCIHRIAGSLDV